MTLNLCWTQNRTLHHHRVYDLDHTSFLLWDHSGTDRVYMVFFRKDKYQKTFVQMFKQQVQDQYCQYYRYQMYVKCRLACDWYLDMQSAPRYYVETVELMNVEPGRIYWKGSVSAMNHAVLNLCCSLPGARSTRNTCSAFWRVRLAVHDKHR